ncbi:MAG: potassium channel family protein [Streptosporangiaceae bacterium]
MTTRSQVSPAPAGPGRAAAGQARSRMAGRFGVLLLILIFTYLLSAFVSGILVSSFQIALFLAALLISLRNSRLQHRSLQAVAAGLVAGSILAVILQALDSQGPGAGVANIWTALVLFLAAVFIVRRVLSWPDIRMQSIYGAVSAYLILGLMFAAVYAAMYHFGGDHFFAQKGQPENTRTWQYFSFVTLTTTGYGDFTAGASGGQAVAVIEAITGQIFLATLVARLVAGFRGSARRAGGQGRPAGARRASTRRAGASGLVGLRPPGTARRRPGPSRPGPADAADQGRR